MKNIFSALFSYAWNNLGNCSSCVHTAFKAAAGGWLLTALLTVVGWSALLPLTFVIAIGLTALWLAHLLVHARKVTVAATHQFVRQPESLVSRRTIFSLFVRTLFVTAVTSAVPALADHVDCPNGRGSCGSDCPDCYRPCWGGVTPCVRCRSCGNECGDHVC